MVVKEVAAKKPAASLPEGWLLVTFGDVVRNVDVTERKPLENGLERYVGLEHLDPESLHIKRWGLVEEGTTFTRRFIEGQVLFGKRRAYQRKAAVAEFDGICSGDILVFEPKGDDLIPELLPFIVQSDNFFQHALSTSAGSLSPRTKWKDLASYEFALPPKNEQSRIADILWAADRAVQVYYVVDENLAAVRESSVNSFLGIEDRAEISNILMEREGRSSKGWKVQSISSLAAKDRKVVQVGPFGSSVSSRHFQDDGTPVLKINNITDDGELDLSNVVYISDEYAKNFERYSVAVGDLITAAQATTGRSALITSECEGAIISQHLIRVSVDKEKCSPDFLLACFRSQLILQQINYVKQKTTRDGLNTEDVENFRIPVPPLQEQYRLVRSLHKLDEARVRTHNHLKVLKCLYKDLRSKLLQPETQA